MEAEGILQQVRAFWDRRPCNIRHSTAPVGSREYFDEVEARKYFVEPHIPGFADFERWRGKSVLEIGCGIGTDSVNFARAGARLTAVDLSPASIELARKRFEVYGQEGEFYCGDAEQLTSFLPVKRYDLIYSFGVIHHTPNPQRVIEQLRAYCGPQTELRVMVYAKWSWKVLWILAAYGKGAVWRLSELVRTHSEAQTGCPVTYYYSGREARELLAPFDVKKAWKDHVFPYRIDRYVKYEYQRVWYFRWMPRPLFRLFERFLGWHLLLVATPRRGDPEATGS